jgi:hypothetical protein
MTHPPQRPLSGARTALVVAAAGAAFLLVSLATRAGSSTPSRPPGWSTFRAAALHGLTGLILALVPVVAVAGTGAWLLGTAMARRRRAEEEARDPAAKRRRRLRWAILALTPIVLALLIRWGIVHVPSQFGGLGIGGGSSHQGRIATRGGSGSPSHADWTIAGVLWLAMAAAAVVAIRRYRRARRVAAAAAVPDEALDDEGGVDYAGLRAIGDPRAAVVASYAQMERTLAQRSMGRDPAEAPGEYLSRIVGGLRRSRQAAGRLTRLYERAKFSPHDVDASMRDDAVDSLRAIDDDTAEAP